MTGKEREPRLSPKISVGVETAAASFHENQDSYFFDLEKRAFGVFDGVTGEIGGKEAALEARDFIKNGLKRLPTGKSLIETGDLLKKIIIGAHKERLHKNVKNNSKATTTATVGLVWSSGLEKACIVGSLGDSRAYLFRRTKLEQKTWDDTIEGKLTHGVGLRGEDPKMTTFSLQERDRIILSSDGGYQNWPSFENAEQILRENKDDLLAARELMKLSVDTNRKDDDKTIMVISVSTNPVPSETTVTISSGKPKVAGPVVMVPRKGEHRKPPKDLEKRVRNVTSGKNEGVDRRILGPVLALGILAAGVGYIGYTGFEKSSESKANKANWIENSYGEFIPLYGEVSAADIPSGADLFFRQKPMNAEFYKISPAGLLISSEIPGEVLEKFAREGTRIVFGDLADSDENFRGALIADKAFVVSNYFNLEEKRTIKTVLNVDSRFTNVDRMLRYGVDYARGRIFEYSNSLLALKTEEAGGLENLFMSRVITLPKDFKASDLKNSEKGKLIVDSRIIDKFMVDAVSKKK